MATNANAVEWILRKHTAMRWVQLHGSASSKDDLYLRDRWRARELPGESGSAMQQLPQYDSSYQGFGTTVKGFA